MRILYLSSEYPPETGFGGIGTYTFTIAHALARRGHEVQVICSTRSQNPRSEHDNDVVVHRTPHAGYPLPQQRWGYPWRVLARRFALQTLGKLSWSKAAAHRAHELSCTNGVFDIVEYPECNGEGFSLDRGVARASVVRFHTPWRMIRSLDDIREGLIDRMLMDTIEVRAARRAHAATAPSRAMATRVPSYRRGDEPAVIPNPIVLESSAPRNTGECWVYTGRVERRKGVHLLLQAYGELRRSVTPPPLVLVGRAYGTDNGHYPYVQVIRDLIDHYELHDCVTWIQGVPHPRVRDHLLRASVAVYPSLWENFPYACLEAMSQGCAVIASRCGGYPEFIDEGRNGLLFEPGSVVALTDVLRQAALNPGQMHQLGLTAHATLRGRFDCDVIAAHTESLYQDLIRSMPHEP